MEFKYVLAGVVAALSVIASGCGGKSVDKYVVSEVANPIPVKFGDPFVLAASDGKYYMYGTSLADGFEAYVSDDEPDDYNRLDMGLSPLLPIALDFPDPQIPSMPIIRGKVHSSSNESF